MTKRLNYRILYANLFAGTLSLAAVIIRGPFYDPLTAPTEFARTAQSAHFLTGVYLSMLAVILSIFSFFALFVFVSEHGQTLRGLWATMLSAAGMALVLSVMAIILYLAPHISKPFYATGGMVKNHLPLIMGLLSAGSFGTGSFLFIQAMARVSTLPRPLLAFYALYALLLGILPFALVAHFPLWSQWSTVFGAAFQVAFGVGVLRWARNFRRFFLA